MLPLLGYPPYLPPPWRTRPRVRQFFVAFVRMTACAEVLHLAPVAFFQQSLTRKVLLHVLVGWL